MGHPPPKAFLIEDGVVKIIQTHLNVFYGVGDTITHYSGDVAKIISLRLDRYQPMRFLYHYLPIKHGYNNELVDEQQALRWTKHEAANSNITNVVNCKETKEAIKEWWRVEHIRRENLPRFFVKIDYPKSEYSVGQIIEPFDKTLFIEDKNKIKELEKYPDVFERISKTLATTIERTGILE